MGENKKSKPKMPYLSSEFLEKLIEESKMLDDHGSAIIGGRDHQPEEPSVESSTDK